VDNYNLLLPFHFTQRTLTQAPLFYTQPQLHRQDFKSHSVKPEILPPSSLIKLWNSITLRGAESEADSLLRAPADPPCGTLTSRMFWTIHHSKENPGTECHHNDIGQPVSLRGQWVTGVEEGLTWREALKRPVSLKPLNG
jgi:hypothetical protein